MAMVEIPDYWILFDPDGNADGSFHGVMQGKILRATAEDAWKDATPLKRDRDREKRQGWHMVGVNRPEWEAYFIHGKKFVAETKEER